MSDLYFTDAPMVDDSHGIECGAVYQRPQNLSGSHRSVPDHESSMITDHSSALAIVSDREPSRAYALERLLVLFASGSWFDMLAARKDIRTGFSQGEYRAMAAEFAASSHTIDAMLDFIQQPEFEVDWAATESEAYVQVCSSIVSRSANPEVRERAFYEGLNAIAWFHTTLHGGKSYLYKQRLIEKHKLQYMLDLCAQGSTCRVMVLNRLIEYANFGPGHLSKANARVGLRKIAVRDGADCLHRDLICGDLEVQYQTITLLVYYNARRAVAPLLYGLVELKDDRLLSLIRNKLEERYAHVYKPVLKELSKKDARFSTLVV